MGQRDRPDPRARGRDRQGQRGAERRGDQAGQDRAQVRARPRQARSRHPAAAAAAQVPGPAVARRSGAGQAARRARRQDGLGVRQGRVQDGRRQGDLPGHRVLVQAAPEGALRPPSCSPRGRPGTTRSATRSATCSSSTSSSPTPARAASASRTSRRSGSPATTCPRTSSPRRSTSCGARSSRCTTSCTATPAASSTRRYGDKVVAEDRPDPVAPARQHVGAVVGLPLPRARAVQGRSADRRHARARQALRRQEDGADGRGVLHVARHGSAAGDVLGALAVHQAGRQERRLPRQRVGRPVQQRPPDQDVYQPEPGGPVDDPPRARPRLLLPLLLQAPDPLSGRRQRRLPRGDRRRDPAVDDAGLPEGEGPARQGGQERQGDDQPADAGRARARSRSCRSACWSTSGGGTCSPARSSRTSTTSTGGT